MYLNLLVESIKKHEGLRLESYRVKTRGKVEPFYTIGYGHRLSQYSEPISLQKAELYLYKDILWSIDIAMNIFYDFSTLNDYYQNFIIEMCFNMGYNLKSFVKANTALLDGDINTAIKEYRNSKWAKQVGSHRVEDMMDILKKGYKQDI